MLDQESCNIVPMKYRIPLSASHGTASEVVDDTAVMYILPQPTAESKRVLIIHSNGFITLWAIQDSKAIFTTGGNVLQSLHHETKKVTAACWACPFGSKVAVGYSNGEIFIWSVPHTTSLKNEPITDKDLSATQSAPLFKLNLGYKLEKVPIATLKWAYADGKASRLYVLGSANVSSSNLLQVVIINEHIESRTTKLGIHLPEPCVSMEVISSSSEQSKHKQDLLLLVGKTGHVYAYDDSIIEKYLIQSQSKSPPSLPKEVMLRLPFIDSSVTVSKIITDNPYLLSSADEDYISLAKNIPPLFAFESKQRDGTSSTHFSSFSNFKNLYITGHSNGAINFWDASCPLFLPIISLTQQSEDDSSVSGTPLTALYFDSDSRLLVSGDQSGTVRIYKFKPEPFATESSFMSLQGSSKKGGNHIIRSLKLVKVNGAVVSLSTSHSLKHLAVGSEQGDVSLIDMEGPTLLYQRHIESELCTSVISLQFGMCSFHGFEKNVLVVATKDSSVLALESDTGNILSSGMVHPKKPSKALFMQILDGHDTSGKGPGSNKGNSYDDGIPKESLLLCSEKAAYVYSLTHVVQGVKKVHYKKKFHSSSCCWASTFYGPSDIGLMLLFSNGKIEIRSLPDMSLLRETSIRGLTLLTSKPNSIPDSSICASQNGEIIVVNGNQEVFTVSVLPQKEIYRHLDSVSQVYTKDLIVPEAILPDHVIHKEKKKGIFSSVIKGSKPKQEPVIGVEDTRESIEELSTIFSVANFPSDTESTENLTMDEDEDELDIDDIEIDNPREKPKGNAMMSALNKQKLTSTFQAFKGKLKVMKGKNEKVPAKEDPQDEKAGAVDQIKKKYGFSLTGDSSAAKVAQNKLNENIKKLKGISLKTAEMQDNAQNFSSMAKEVLRTAENDRRSS